ncbi:branched-chain amino acid ABC transporter substrate-binding protein [Martelella radicis]|uniref:Branched-chain amino acid transport system substrate-binding protein n=1 Tax=Martelella radicis TaxID=1397476 RepID=A0A7W6P9C8_9HYPH|nr:branched-chain amino acid ABC transporter substrate-binding protein [Martelella radicis]MBB4121675.1 branched-chain amino acid transport system substrate-binding protein [Martelella radicis]
MRLFKAFLALAALSFSAATPANAQQGSIGVVAPVSGDYAVLGAQMLDGAGLAARGLGVELTVVDESCEDGSGDGVAEALEDAGVAIAVGFFCSETLRGALPGLAAAGIPAVTVSVRSLPLMADARDNGWPLYRMAPNRQDQVDAIVDLIMSEWVDRPVALVDDGTIYYRELINAVRNAIEARGLEPVFIDTFRPAQQQQLSLVRRLSQAGATHVLVGGTRGDVAIIARDAREQGAPLTLLGDDGLRAARTNPPLADGVLAMALPEYGELPPAADLAEAARAEAVVPEGYVIPGAAAVELASQALLAAEDAGNGIDAALLNNSFMTAIGPVSFTAAHELSDNPFFLLRWQNGAFVPVFDSERQ